MIPVVYQEENVLDIKYLEVAYLVPRSFPTFPWFVQELIVNQVANNFKTIF